MNYAFALMEKLGIQNVYATIKSYLDDIFSIKALIKGMPKFGSDSDSVLKGIVRLLLVL